MFKFNRIYFILFVILLVIEIIIGVYAHDAYIRPYGGDFLVVILIYCLIRGFTKYDVNSTAIGTLLFAYAVEVSQGFHLINLLGLQNSRVACIIMGTSFAWTDILMYTLGILMVWFIENRWRRI